MIPVTSPVTQPATTYSGWWIDGITLVAPTPTSPAQARISMHQYDPATGLLQPGGGMSFVIADIFGAALADPVTGAAVGGAVSSLLSAVQAVATQRNLL